MAPDLLRAAGRGRRARLPGHPVHADRRLRPRRLASVTSISSSRTGRAPWFRPAAPASCSRFRSPSTDDRQLTVAGRRHPGDRRRRPRHRHRNGDGPRCRAGRAPPPSCCFRPISWSPSRQGLAPTSRRSPRGRRSASSSTAATTASFRPTPRSGSPIPARTWSAQGRHRRFRGARRLAAARSATGWC